MGHSESSSEKSMNERIEIMARRTWEVIGGDVLTVMGEQNLPQVMTREEVVECVCDASYMLTHGGDKEAYKHWNGLPGYDAKMAAVRSAFPHARYGW